MPPLSSDKSGDRSDRVGLLMAAWVAHDPEAATEWMRPRIEQFARIPAFGSGYSSVETVLVGKWVRGAPELALEVARRYPQSKVAEQILWDVMYLSRDKDDAQRFELLREFPPGSARQNLMRRLCERWSKTDFPAALAGIASMAPDAERTETLRNMLASFATRDWTSALARAEAFGVADDPKTAQRLAMAAGDKAPWVTARWLEARDPSLLRSAGPWLVLAWAEKEPATAFKWALSHGIDIGAHVLAGADADSRSWASRGGPDKSDSPMEVAIAKKPEAVKAWLRAQPAGDARDTAVVQTLRAMRDPREMIPLLDLLPPEAGPEAATLVAERFRYVSLGFDVAKQWAGNLPPGPTRTAVWTTLGEQHALAIVPDVPRGPDRDAMLRGMAQAPLSSVLKPERPMDYVLQIDDPALRRQTFDDVMNRWIDNPKRRDTAGPWLDGATVPEAWKAKWRERLKQ